MDAGKVIVIDNSVDKSHKEGSAFLGRYFIAQIWAAATARSSRPRSQRKPVYVYIDEADSMLDATVAEIIDRCRSQNIALIMAHQRASHIKDPNVLGALENCAIKMVNVDAEAKYFSQLLHIPVERMNNLPIGHFALHVRGEGSSIVSVPLAKLPISRMNPREKDHHQKNMQKLYGVETQIAASKEAAVSGGHQPPVGNPIVTQEGPARAGPSAQMETPRSATPPKTPIITPESDLPKPQPWKRT